MEKNSAIIYLDRARIRRKNKRINFKEIEAEFIFVFEIFDNENANNPVCLHECIRGKIRKTSLKLSKQTLDDLVSAYISYRSKF